MPFYDALMTRLNSLELLRDVGYIDGQWIGRSEVGDFKIENPATREVLATLARDEIRLHGRAVGPRSRKAGGARIHDFPEELLRGYASFRNSKFPSNRDRYEFLASKGQSPTTLVIACCDSRAAPETIFGSDPGQIFVMHNVGNIVSDPSQAKWSTMSRSPRKLGTEPPRRGRFSSHSKISDLSPSLRPGRRPVTFDSSGVGSTSGLGRFGLSTRPAVNSALWTTPFRAQRVPVQASVFWKARQSESATG